jgi:diguanylate cyclase (GGDEF)-like protein
MPPAWVGFLAAIPFVAAFYLLLPTTGLVRTIVYPVFGLIGTVAILVGLRLRPPSRRRSWYLIALAFALMSVGDITYSILHIGGENPYPSMADLGYLAGYVALILGFGGLIHGRIPGGDRTSIIDAAILSAGAGSLFWVIIIQPSLVGTVDPLSALVTMLYPALDLVLLALGLRVLLTAAARPRYLQFLVAGISLYFIADVIYTLEVLHGTYVDGNPVDAGWIVGIFLVGVAALHPSVSDPVSTVPPRDARLTRARFVLLAGAALVAPTILLTRDAQVVDTTVFGLVVEWTILFILVLIRLATTVNQLAVSLRERRQLQDDLSHQANHDPLTRLANRLLFEARLAEATAKAPERTALVFLDLDDFKAINDTLGHPTGDELLRIIGLRVPRGLRKTDLAARLGGDEFAILVEDCDGVKHARAVAERALKMLRAPVTINDRPLLVHASAGVAMGRPGSTSVDLMRDADIAMYRAKARGKDQVEIYEEGMHSQITLSYELRTELAEAIEANAFVLHYQPVLNLENGEIVAAEALVRWNHPVRGLLAPGEFIPEAESSGLIQKLGLWILREACTTAASWPDRSKGGRAAIEVNLAALQLHDPGLVDDVALILAETGLPPDRLVLEVTETALVDLAVARVALLRLRSLGVRLALDDFGTGYSALSYLAQLPFDIVKIDRSFVAGIGKGRRTDALLEAIFGLSDALELDAIAEGIEETSQLHRLRGLGCRMGQGFLFARPAPAHEFLLLMASAQLGGPWPSSTAAHATRPASGDPRHGHRPTGSAGRSRKLLLPAAFKQASALPK